MRIPISVRDLNNSAYLNSPINDIWKNIKNADKVNTIKKYMNPERLCNVFCSIVKITENFSYIARNSNIERMLSVIATIPRP